jgi:uncharacterized protein (DUF302 family)
MTRYIPAFLALFLTAGPLQADSDVAGLVVKQSQYSVAETLDRLEKALTEKGITIVTRWNHAEKANAVDIPLRPTELLIFGNPKLGSQLFTSQQTAGIDLPLKALAWEDAEGNVWLGYNAPQYIAERHHITDRAEAVTKMSGALNKLSDIATGKE